MQQLRSCMCTLPRVVLPDRAVCLPTFCHSIWTVNKPLLLLLAYCRQDSRFRLGGCARSSFSLLLRSYVKSYVQNNKQSGAEPAPATTAWRENPQQREGCSLTAVTRRAQELLHVARAVVVLSHRVLAAVATPVAHAPCGSAMPPCTARRPHNRSLTWS